MRALLLLISLTGCTQVITPIPELPSDVRVCESSDHPVATNEDLIYEVYGLRHDFLVCRQKHQAVLDMYDNLRIRK